MSGVVACPVCGSGNARTTERCWVCGAPLAGAAPVGAPPPDRTQSGTRTFQLLGWSALLLALGFTALLIGVELALEWPGLLIPYAVVVLVAFAALGRTAWVQIRKPVDVSTPTTRTGDATGPPDGKITGAEVAQGVALGLTIALAVIAGLILLMVAAMVIFFLICLALVAGAGGIH